MKQVLQIIAIFILLAGPLQANQDGIVVRQSPVHADASGNSPRVGVLNAGSRVSIFGRKGGWKEIFSEEKSLIGWVRSYQVREGAFTEQATNETQEDSRGFLAGLASFSRKASRFFGGGGSSNTNSGTATIGVRGLSEAEIKSAQPDLEELAKMQQYASDRKRLKKFQRNGQLSSNDVPHIKSANKKKSGSGAGATDK